MFYSDPQSRESSVESSANTPLLRSSVISISPLCLEWDDAVLADGICTVAKDVLTWLKMLSWCQVDLS
jgi:hypothetical protein